MKVVLFGATGMVGQGALRECLLDPEVEQVLAVGRRLTGQRHPKLRELRHADFLDFTALEPELSGFDACLYCLGVSSLGMAEPDYRRVTCDYTLAAARTLARLNPAMTFVFVSGAGTDAGGRSMWARVKGQTENALLELPFKAVYLFRPAAIEPRDGITSRTASYRILYRVLRPLFALLKLIFPGSFTTTSDLGRAMLRAARSGAPGHVIESGAIAGLAR
jgi:uncharacterized protein YbjT (DUF2867 family)